MASETGFLVDLTTPVPAVNIDTQAGILVSTSRTIDYSDGYAAGYAAGDAAGFVRGVGAERSLKSGAADAREQGRADGFRAGLRAGIGASSAPAAAVPPPTISIVSPTPGVVPATGRRLPFGLVGRPSDADRSSTSTARA
jgi:hypothetical protein